MTEAEWLDGADPDGMLDALGRKASGRKLRLFAAACARRSFAWLASQPTALAVVETAEQLADGQAGRADLQKARRALSGSMPVGLVWTARAKPVDAARFWAQDQCAGAREANAAMLREVFANPLRPPVMEAAWRTAAVTAVAQAIYDERRFGDLPILADALEDAGCTDRDILAHCRAPGPHVRGCWAVDLVLGNEPP